MDKLYVMKKITIIVIICGLVLQVGCNKKEIAVEKEQDLDFTVVEQIDIPDKLADEISSKKESGFKIAYEDGEYMYIAIGYGKKDTGGYNVVIKELFLTRNSIYVNSSLIGPRENEMVLKANTYPYIVIKLENRNLNVVFNA